MKEEYKQFFLKIHNQLSTCNSIESSNKIARKQNTVIKSYHAEQDKDPLCTLKRYFYLNSQEDANSKLIN